MKSSHSAILELMLEKEDGLLVIISIVRVVLRDPVARKLLLARSELRKTAGAV